MLQINVIREQTSKVLEGLKKRNLRDAEELVQKVIETDKTRRDTQQILDNLKAQSNADSKNWRVNEEREGCRGTSFA